MTSSSIERTKRFLSHFWKSFFSDKPLISEAQAVELAEPYFVAAGQVGRLIKRRARFDRKEFLIFFPEMYRADDSFRPFLNYLAEYEQLGCILPMRLHREDWDWHLFSSFLDNDSNDGEEFFWQQHSEGILEKEKGRIRNMFECDQVIGNFYLSIEETTKEGPFYRIKGSVYSEAIFLSLTHLVESEKHFTDSFFFFFERRVKPSTARLMAGNNQIQDPQSICEAITNYPYLFSCSFSSGKSTDFFFCSSPGLSTKARGSRPIRTPGKTKSFSIGTISYKKISEFHSLTFDFFSAPDSIEVFNVGLGNFVSLSKEKETIPVALFDGGIGFRGGMEPSQMQKMNDYLKSFSGFIILSHLHFDHYGMLAMAQNKNVLQALSWLVPFETGPLYSLYLVNFLNGIQKRGTLYCFDVPKCTIAPNCTLYKGTGNSSDVNSSGAILQIENQGNYALLSGDCSYGKMPSEIFNYSYSFLLGAHHGERTSASSICPRGKGKAFAVFSCRNLPSIKRPNLTHISLLRKSGFSIFVCTETAKANIAYFIGLDALAIL